MCRIGLTVHLSSTVYRSQDVTFFAEVQWMSVTHQRKAASSPVVVPDRGSGNSVIHENKESLLIKMSSSKHISYTEQTYRLCLDEESEKIWTETQTVPPLFMLTPHEGAFLTAEGIKTQKSLCLNKHVWMMHNNMMTIKVSCCSRAWNQTFLLLCMDLNWLCTWV